MIRTILQVALPVAFLALGALMFTGIMAMSTAPNQADAVAEPIVVEVTTVSPSEHRAQVIATGTVQASTSIDVMPQVAGKVVDIAKGLTPGLELPKGMPLATIDRRDYAAQLTQAEAQLAQAELNLAIEEARVLHTAREFELLGSEASTTLALREPQLVAAKANVASAKAVVHTAQLALERTRLTVPFDAIVTSESLEIGQYVAPGAPVARVIGTDRFRIRVSVPVGDLDQLEVTQADGTRGSTALVRQDLGNGAGIEREGFVLRILGELDEQTRTAQVLVALDDPMNADLGPVIRPGAYVKVSIDGTARQDIARIPRVAVVDGSSVWIADPEDRLERRDVDIAWGDASHVFVRDGLAAGERVVVTPMALPMPGQPLDVRDAVAAAP